jgi:hypothetical protein
MQNQDQSPSLPNYERTAACLLVIAVVFFSLINIYLDEGEIPETTGETVYVVPPFVEISIKGAVAKPGVYQVKKGTLVQEVLQMADPLPTANLKKIKQDSKIIRRRTIDIKEVGLRNKTS